MQPRHIVTARLIEKLTTALCHRSYIPYLITIHCLRHIVIFVNYTRTQRAVRIRSFFGACYGITASDGRKTGDEQESDNRITRASRSVLALKIAWILHAARAFRSVSAVGERGAERSGAYLRFRLERAFLLADLPQCCVA